MQIAKNEQGQTKQTRDMDVVGLILEDHRPLKELIKIMKDGERSQEERFEAFEVFAPALIAHAKPEEKTLYVYMKDNEELKEEGCEGDVEHALADQLVNEIKTTSDEDMKAAKIKVLAELVEHHIEEEEENLLPKFKKESDLETRVEIGNNFMQIKLDYLSGMETKEEEPASRSIH